MSDHEQISVILLMAAVGVPIGEDAILAFRSAPEDKLVELDDLIFRRAGITPPHPDEVSAATYMMVVITSEVAQPFAMVLVVAYDGRPTPMVFVAHPGEGLQPLPPADWADLHVTPTEYQNLILMEA